MKIKLLNCSHSYNAPNGVNALNVWISPDGKFAVAEVFAAEYFVAGRIEETEEGSGIPTIICTDQFSTESSEVDFHSYRVDWSSMEYGFCKLRSRSLESYRPRTFRIYFDPELYRQKYEERNGVPYEGNKKFHR